MEKAPMKYWRSIILIISFFVSTSVVAQKVTVSQDINIRNDFTFHMIGKVKDKILLYRDQGNDKKVVIFDEAMVMQSERQLNLIEKRPVVYDLVNLDTAFGVFYGFLEKDEAVLQLDIFSPSLQIMDSIEVFRSEKNKDALQYQTITSEDGSKIAFYNTKENELIKVIIYDVQKKETLLNSEYIIRDADMLNSIMQYELSNKGNLLMLTERGNNRNDKQSHIALIYHFLLSGNTVEQISIPLENIVLSDLFMSIDNYNNRVGVCGLYDEKRDKQSVGYFGVVGSIDNWDREPIHLVPFEKEVFFELYGDRNKKRLENFTINNVLWKEDGSLIMILEMSVDVVRRNGGVGALSSNTRFSNSNDFGGLAGWSDHYREDLLVLSLDKMFKKEWSQVFYKKQFSQNDQAVYSSVYSFVTPSRARLLFNDEIRNNSTVSEYIFDGMGNFKRSSVLSTEYQSLRLRFKDAVQISNTEVLVPSQRNYVLNLVKIDYSK
jgi:hypothetical protein